MIPHWFDCSVWISAIAVLLIFCLILGNILWHGVSAIDWHFLTAAPENAGRSGGIGPILVSTMFILIVCMVVSMPLGLGTAILLSEFTSEATRFARVVRVSLDVLAGIPSIVFGLFGNAFFCKYLGLGFSILSGGLTLSCMVLPILIRSIEDGLRAVPNEYRRNGAALGLSKFATIQNIILPLAIPGLVVGVALGIGRAVAETAALIFTSGYVDRMPESLMDSGRALSLHIYDLSMNISGGDKNAYGASLVLVLVLVMTNGFAARSASLWMQKRIRGC